jgi:hypothetical protein
MRETLSGINDVSIIIEQIQIVPKYATYSGVSVQNIKTDVELKLRGAGLKVITPEEATKTLSPYLGVKIQLVKIEQLDYFIPHLAVELYQFVTLYRNPLIKTSSPTWSVETIGGVSGIRLSDHVRKGISDIVDMFINAYLSVNPKH